MTIITSKRQFLKYMSDCERHINWLIKDDKKLNHFIEGTSFIKQVLKTMPDKLPFCAIESLNFEEKFTDFICDSNDDELKIRLKSIAQELSAIGAKYQQYIPLLQQEVEYYKHKKRRLSKECISKSELINYIKNNNLANVEQKFKSILELLRTNVAWSKQDEVPTGVEQANMRLRLEERLGVIALQLHDKNSPLCSCMISAKNELKSMIFPKNDKNVLNCYLMLMETIDNIGTEDETVTTEHITSLINQWKTLNR